MPGYVMGNFIVYCLINAFTPGPGNILALNTVTNYGWKKGIPLFVGIFSGYYVVQLICAGVVFGISALLPPGAGNYEVCGSCVYSMARHTYCNEPTGPGLRGKISILLEGVYPAVCKCKNLFVWDYGADRVCDKLLRHIPYGFDSL